MKVVGQHREVETGLLRQAGVRTSAAGGCSSDESA